MADETILLIDIDEQTEQKIVAALESKGHLVFSAAGRDAAIQIAEKVRPSLICVNPAPSGGLELCRELHDKAFLSEVPIIITTSYSGTMDPRYTSLYGIVDFLTVPFSQEQLLEKIGTLLKSGVPGSRDEEAEREDSRSSEDTGSLIPEHARGADRETETAPDYDLPIDEDEGIVSPEEPVGKMEKAALAAAFRSRRPPRRSESRSRPLLIVLVLILVTASGIAAGLYGYRLFAQKAGNTGPQSVIPDAARTSSVTGQSQMQQPPSPPSPQEAVQKPLAEPAVQATAPAKVQRQTAHSVQAGAFRNETNAEALAKMIQEKGFDAFVRKGQTKDKEPVYRVLIGEYSERKDALASAGKIEKGAAIKVTIYSE